MEIKNVSVIEKKSISPYVFSQLGGSLYGGNYLSPNQAYWLWTMSDAVGNACDLIAWAFEQLDPVLKDKKTGEYIVEHPLIELINNPGFKMSSDQFQFQFMTSYLVTGETYPVLEGNVNYEPFGMYTVSANYTSLVQAGDGWLGEIQTTADFDHDEYFRTENRKRKIWTYQNRTKLKETIQILNQTKRTGIRAQSVLERIYYQTLMKYYGNMHNTSMLKNASRPGGLWMPAAPMSQANYEAFKNEVDEKFNGPINAGKNIVAPTPVKYEDFLLNPRDMDFIKLIENSRKEIYSQYQIPLPLVSTETMTMNNYENAINALYHMAVMPKSKFLYKQLGKFILPRYKDGDRFELVINEKEIPALKDKLFARVKEMRETYAFNENELRTEAGYEGIGDEGEQIWKPSSLIPSGESDDLDKIQERENEEEPNE